VIEDYFSFDYRRDYLIPDIIRGARALHDIPFRRNGDSDQDHVFFNAIELR